MFEGFLPVNRKQKKERLAELLQEKRTVIFYEAPHKLRTTLDDLTAAVKKTGDQLEDLMQNEKVSAETKKELEEASTVYIDDAAFWEQKYPGYTLNRVETKVSNAGQRHTVVILRRAECWHGRGNIYRPRRK